MKILLNLPCGNICYELFTEIWQESVQYPDLSIWFLIVQFGPFSVVLGKVLEGTKIRRRNCPGKRESNKTGPRSIDDQEEG